MAFFLPLAAMAGLAAVLGYELGPWVFGAGRSAGPGAATGSLAITSSSATSAVDPNRTLLALPGLDRWTADDRAALVQVADALGIPVDSLTLVLFSESRLDPTALNPLPAAGLNQLTLGANLPPYTTKDAIRAIASMSAADQLWQVVYPYYARMGSKPQGADPGKLYMLNYLASFADAPDNTVLARQGDDSLLLPGKSKLTLGQNYAANPGFDPQHVGQFTVGDVHAAIAKNATAAHGRMTVAGVKTAGGPAPALACVPVKAHPATKELWVPEASATRRTAGGTFDAMRRGDVVRLSDGRLGRIADGPVQSKCYPDRTTEVAVATRDDGAVAWYDMQAVRKIGDASAPDYSDDTWRAFDEMRARDWGIRDDDRTIDASVPWLNTGHPYWSTIAPDRRDRIQRELWGYMVAGADRTAGGAGADLAALAGLLVVGGVVVAGAAAYYVVKLSDALHARGAAVLPPGQAPLAGYAAVDPSLVLPAFVEVFGTVRGPQVLAFAVSRGWGYQSPVGSGPVCRAASGAHGAWGDSPLSSLGDLGGWGADALAEGWPAAAPGALGPWGADAARLAAGPGVGGNWGGSLADGMHFGWGSNSYGSVDAWLPPADGYGVYPDRGDVFGAAGDAQPPPATALPPPAASASRSPPLSAELDPLTCLVAVCPVEVATEPDAPRGPGFLQRAAAWVRHEVQPGRRGHDGRHADLFALGDRVQWREAGQGIVCVAPPCTEAPGTVVGVRHTPPGTNCGGFLSGPSGEVVIVKHDGPFEPLSWPAEALVAEPRRAQGPGDLLPEGAGELRDPAIHHLALRNAPLRRAGGAGGDLGGSARGVLRAVMGDPKRRAGIADGIQWAEVPVPALDLVVTVPADALGVDGLRLPVSYDDQVAICNWLGLVSPLKEMVDACWQHAKQAAADGGGGVIQAYPLNVNPADPSTWQNPHLALVRDFVRALGKDWKTAQLGLYMETWAFTQQLNRNIAAEKEARGFEEGTFVRSLGKSWVFDPRMAEGGAANYGWFDLQGQGLQGQYVGGRHNAAHSDCSQLFVDCPKRFARRISDGSAVDLLAFYAVKYPGLKKYLAAYAGGGLV